MERCPVCRARFKDEPVCYRCGADLSVLLAIEAEVAALEQQAVVLLGTGAWIKAHRTAERILALQSSPLAAAVLNLSRQELIASEVQALEQRPLP
ncbi:MAG TPA: hypothetical protein PK018_10485 [Candidatus Competibacter sp.]|nr:hypothetical protein [Candidatus Competibacteraceae bacterium]HPE72574.1 hypothetical protein [Candidatus Competibacter sp.]HRW65253.1 hypothetical protein [Candidatus Competibacter sp.]